MWRSALPNRPSHEAEASPQTCICFIFRYLLVNPNCRIEQRDRVTPTHPRQQTALPFRPTSRSIARTDSIRAAPSASNAHHRAAPYSSPPPPADSAPLLLHRPSQNLLPLPSRLPVVAHRIPLHRNHSHLASPSAAPPGRRAPCGARKYRTRSPSTSSIAAARSPSSSRILRSVCHASHGCVIRMVPHHVPCRRNLPHQLPDTPAQIRRSQRTSPARPHAPAPPATAESPPDSAHRQTSAQSHPASSAPPASAKHLRPRRQCRPRHRSASRHRRQPCRNPTLVPTCQDLSTQSSHSRTANYSARSATIGFTRVALHPGPSAAPSAVSSSSIATIPRLTGSVGLTPTSMLSTSRASATLNATAHRNPHARHLRRMPQHRPQNRPALRPKRHPYSKLKPPLRHRVRHRPIHPQHRQQQPHARKQRDQRRTKPLRRHRLVHHRIHRRIPPRNQRIHLRNPRIHRVISDSGFTAVRSTT